MPKCNILSNHLSITVDGKWQPCCYFKRQPDNEFSTDDYTYDQYKQSDFYVNLKNTMDSDNWHSGCNDCERREDHGSLSQRQRFNKILSGNDTVEYIEVSFSNECNIACLTCGPWASSKWTKVAKNNDLGDFLSWKFKNPGKNDISHIKNDIISVDQLQNLKLLKILGGEPTLMPSVYKFLEALKEADILKNISLVFNTNCTFFPKKILPFLPEAKAVHVSLSIDAIGPLNDYVREGSDWNTTLKVVDEWKHYASTYTSINLKIANVVSALTVHQIDKVLEFSKTVTDVPPFYIILSGPKSFCIDALPKEYIDTFIEKYKDIDELKDIYNILVNSTYNPRYNAQLVHYLDTMEKISGKTLRDYIDNISFLDHTQSRYRKNNKRLYR